jgi:hypothetical protein
MKGMDDQGRQRLGGGQGEAGCGNTEEEQGRGRPVRQLTDAAPGRSSRS